MPAFVTLDTISFRAPDGRSLLDNLTLAFGAERTGLVGRNGVGKTTLIRLLIGALTPTEGTVRRAPGLAIGYVPQRLAIDHTMPLPVSRFLALASRDRAARTAALARVGASGLEARQMIDLSGGQFQRVMLAHALLRRPDLLVLDEATSALDNETEARVAETIAALSGELTMIVVAHRLSTVRTCDRVAFMEQGRVVAVDTFDALRRDNEAFARLVSLGALG